MCIYDYIEGNKFYRKGYLISSDVIRNNVISSYKYNYSISVYVVYIYKSYLVSTSY